MKKLIFFAALLLLGYTSVFAQFTSATVVESGFGTGSSGVAHTGNDNILDNGNLLKVSVWDGSSPTLGYDYAGTQGSVGLQNSTVNDPDVCLVKDANGIIYAIVVYHTFISGSPHHYWEWYMWGGGTFTNGGGGTLTNINFQNTINIDGDDFGHFVIVWDDNGPLVWTISGRTSTIFGPILTGSPFKMSTVGKQPDVSLYNDGSNTVNVKYCWYTNVTSGVEVDVETWSNIVLGTPTYNVVHSATPATNYIYSWPRIACPSSAGGSCDFVVVFENTNGSRHEISSIVNLNDCQYSSGIRFTTYTDASVASLPTLNGTFNDRPVVTYDDGASNNIFFGWTFDNSSPYYGSGTQGKYPIVILCNNSGTPLGTGSTAIWEVPRNNLTDTRELSIAGRHSSYNTYTFWKNNATADVYFKNVSQTLGSLKAGDQDQPGSIFYPNPITDRVYVSLTGYDDNEMLEATVCNLLGEVSYTFKGNKEFVRQLLEEKCASLEKGVYLVRINSAGKTNSLVEKIIRL